MAGIKKNTTSYQGGGLILPTKRIGHFGRGGAIAGSTVKGALGGAATGAALGSVIPVWGTAVGAAVGFIAGGIKGLFGGKKKEDAKELAARENAENKRKLLAMNALTNDSSALSVFPTKGVETAPFGLKDGGPAPSTFQALHGGSLKPLSSGVFLAKGRSHKQGGIKGDTDFDGQVDTEMENNELFFPDVGKNGFVVNKDISRKFIPQFRKITGNTKLDIDTRNLLISRAVTENENRRAEIERPISSDRGSRASRGVRPTSEQARRSGSNLFKRPKSTGTNRTVGTQVVKTNTDLSGNKTKVRLTSEEAFGPRPRGRKIKTRP